MGKSKKQKRNAAWKGVKNVAVKIDTKKDDPKPYEIKMFRKRANQLSNYIYELPLDIKKIIFRMAIENHMDIWKKEHVNNMMSWFDDPSKWHIPFSTLDLIRCHGIQAPSPNYFNYVPENTYGFRVEIKLKYKSTLCKPKKIIYENKDGYRYLIGKKTDIFKIKKYIPYDIMLKIRGRKTMGDEGHYWVEKKCRCLTCDLVRLAHYQDRRHLSGPKDRFGTTATLETISKDFNKKYERTTYIRGQWKTRTESEGKALTPKELKMLKKQNKK